MTVDAIVCMAILFLSVLFGLLLVMVLRSYSEVVCMYVCVFCGKLQANKSKAIHFISSIDGVNCSTKHNGCDHFEDLCPDVLWWRKLYGMCFTRCSMSHKHSVSLFDNHMRTTDYIVEYTCPGTGLDIFDTVHSLYDEMIINEELLSFVFDLINIIIII